MITYHLTSSQTSKNLSNLLPWNYAILQVPHRMEPLEQGSHRSRSVWKPWTMEQGTVTSQVLWSPNGAVSQVEAPPSTSRTETSSAKWTSCTTSRMATWNGVRQQGLVLPSEIKAYMYNIIVCQVINYMCLYFFRWGTVNFQETTMPTFDYI